MSLVMRGLQQLRRLLGIGHGLGPNGDFDILPLFGTAIELAVSVKGVSLVAGSDAAAPFVEVCPEVDDVVRLGHCG